MGRQHLLGMCALNSYLACAGIEEGTLCTKVLPPGMLAGVCRYSDDVLPDVWFDAQTVWEVRRLPPSFLCPFSHPCVTVQDGAKAGSVAEALFENSPVSRAQGHGRARWLADCELYFAGEVRRLQHQPAAQGGRGAGGPREGHQHPLPAPGESAHRQGPRGRDLRRAGAGRSPSLPHASCLIRMHAYECQALPVCCIVDVLFICMHVKATSLVAGHLTRHAARREFLSLLMVHVVRLHKPSAERRIQCTLIEDCIGGACRLQRCTRSRCRPRSMLLPPPPTTTTEENAAGPPLRAQCHDAANQMHAEVTCIVSACTSIQVCNKNSLNHGFIGLAQSHGQSQDQS